LNGKKDVDDSASMEQLQNCAIKYCRADWANSPVLELWLVRQLIYAETYSFSREMGIPIQQKSLKFWWMWTKSLVKWSVGLVVAVSIGSNFGPAIGVATYVGWLAAIRYLAQDQIDQLNQLHETITSMRNAYIQSLRSPACPVEIESCLALAESHNVVWPAGMRGLVDAAVNRNRVLWL
jgi:hypothetical protein